MYSSISRCLGTGSVTSPLVHTSCLPSRNRYQPSRRSFRSRSALFKCTPIRIRSQARYRERVPPPCPRGPEGVKLRRCPELGHEPVLVALEGAGWSFAALRQSPLLVAGVRAVKEAAAVVAKHQHGDVPASTALLSAWMLALGLPIARWTMPFDLERYLSYHFTKVGDQTRQMIADYEALGRQHGVATPALSGLRERVLQ